MHGIGDSAEGFLDIFGNQRINPASPDTKIVLLTAPSRPVTINGGMTMPSWYDIKNLSNDSRIPIEKRISIEQINESYKRINNVVMEEMKNLKGKLFLGGFSQGCVMALYVGLENLTVKGIFGFSGVLHLLTKMDNLGKIPIYLFHGTLDDVIPLQIAKGTYDKILKDKQVKFFLEKNVGHGVNMSQLAQFKKVFSEALKF